MAAVFWGCIGALLYTYFGYAALLALLSRVRARPVRRAASTPRVSVIVAVHNGATAIAAKLDNLCGGHYPADRMDILVVSDGSTDETAAIVTAYADPRVRLLTLPERQGKEIAQQQGIAQATGEVCIFTDVAAELGADAVARIVEPFADPRVGAVTSRNVTTAGTGEGAFIRYDIRLREWESAIGSVVGLSGALFAVRRELCDEWPTDVPSDFYTVLSLVRRGWRAVLEPRAVVTYRSTESVQGEFQRKVRTVQRGIATLMRVPGVLLPWRTGLFALQIASHKLLRWCVPLFMLGALFSCVLLRGRGPYDLLLWAQVAYYAAAALGLAWSGFRRLAVLRLAGYMVLTNVSIVIAWLQYLRHGTVQTWQPTTR